MPPSDTVQARYASLYSNGDDPIIWEWRKAYNFMNSKERISRHITRTQMAELIDAATFAWRTERPLNRSLNFNLKKLAISPHQFVSNFTKLAGDWLRTQGYPRVYLYVLEHPPMKSLNCHMLMYVPSELKLAFSRRERSWTIRAGLKWEKDILVLEAEPLGDRPKKKSIDDHEYIRNLIEALGYRLKGGDPAACDILGIDVSNEGDVQGKRVGWSENIGKKARDDTGFVPQRGVRGYVLFWWRHRL